MNEDVTKKYAHMIERFECDFSLAMDEEDNFTLNSLQSQIDQRNEQLISDINLMGELAFGLRTGDLKIVSYEQA